MTTNRQQKRTIRLESFSFKQSPDLQRYFSTSLVHRSKKTRKFRTINLSSINDEKKFFRTLYEKSEAYKNHLWQVQKSLQQQAYMVIKQGKCT
jgi:hypothetical protein